MGIRSAYDVGRNEFEVTGFLPYFRKIVVALSDLDENLQYKIPIQAGKYVLGVGAKVNVPFDSQGEPPTLTVSTSTVPEAFIAPTDPLPLVGPDLCYFSHGSVSLGGHGMYFAAPDYLVVEITAVAPTQGELTILIEELDASENWRSAGDIGQNG